jgi:pilus assembly protein CpaC
MTQRTCNQQRESRFPRLQRWSLIVGSILCSTSTTLAQTDGLVPPSPAAGGMIAPRFENLRIPRRLPPEAMTETVDLDAGDMRSREERFLAERVDPGRTLDLQVGRPTVLRFHQPPFRDQVGDPSIVEVLNLTEQELSINGLAVGSTVLNLWFESKDAPGGQEVLSYLVRVSEDPDRSRRFEELLANLEKDVNRAFPNSVVKLSYVGSEVLVRGKAKDIDEATQILRIVSQSLPTTDAEERFSAIRDALTGNALITSQTLRASLQQTPAGPGFLSGQFDPALGFVNPAMLDPDRIEQAGGTDGIASGRTITGANAARINSRVVNMLEIAGVHQVQLKVTLAEVVRDAGRSLVTDLRIGDSVIRPGSTSIDFSAIEGVGQFAIESNRFFLQVDALKRLGLARSLAEPNLTSLNGQPANFLVGGQFPILESTSTVAAVSQNIRFIPFGVQLMVIPTVSDGDRIRLNLMATVSEQAGGGLGIGGGAGGGGGGGIGGGNVNNDPSQPPSLSTRSFQTTVELRSNESLAVAGLIRTSLVNSSVRVPFLGDIPVVGNLFSNNRNSYQEQELILVVTPQLVSPVPATRRQPLPGSDSFEPDDLEFFIHGNVTGHIAEDYRTPVRSDLEKMHAFRRAEQKYIIGRPGHTSGQVLPLPKSNIHQAVEVTHDPNF